MKIYKRAEFLKLPEGTIFSQGERWCFYGLQVKGETLGNDFIERSLIDIRSEGCEDWSEKLEEMLADGTSYPIDDAYGRDGLFEDDALFLVYEKSDLEELKNVINAALEAVE